MLAQISGRKLQLGGLFNGFKINENEYKDVIKAFKDLDLSKPIFLNKDGSTNWDKISESIEDCDTIALSYFKTLDKGNGVINKQSASVEGLGAYLKTTGQMFDFAKIKAMALNTVLNMSISLLVSAGISFLVKGIDNLIHAEEKAIEAGEEAQGKIKSLSKDYREHAATTRKLGTRYDELSSGVDKYGNNIGLTDEDYKEFLDISNQLVEIYPELLDHYDSSGNAILNLGKNSESAAEQLEALLEQERRMANYDIEQELPDVYKGIETSISQQERLINSYEEQATSYQNISNKLKDLNEELNITGNTGSISFKSPNAADYDPDEMSAEYISAIMEAFEKQGLSKEKYELFDDGLISSINLYDITESDKKKIKFAFESLAETYDYAYKDTKKKITATESSQKQQYSNLGTHISSWITTTDDFVTLSDDMQSAVQSALNSLDYSQIDFSSLEDLKQYLMENFITIFSTENPEVQSAIDELFSLDKSDMSVEEYRNKVNSLVEQIVGSGSENAQARIDFRVAFGFTAVGKDGYERLNEDTMLQDIANETGIPFDDLSKKLDVGDIQLAFDLVSSGEFKGTSIEELKSAIQAKASEAAMSIEALTTSYNNMNTEISAATSALSEQTTGQSIALDTYNELIKTNADYADALEYVNGSMQLNADKVKEITKAKAEETIATNEATKAQNQMDYLANAKEIETLTQKLKAKNFTGEETAETVQAQIDAFKTENDTIVSTCKQIDLMNTSLRQSIGTYQAWKDAQNAPQSGDMFDDALTAMDDIWDIWDEESENFMKVGNDTYKTAVEFLIPDTVDHQDMEAVKEYMRSIKKYLTWDDDGNQDGLDLGEFIQASVDEGLMYLDETSNQYMVAGQKTMEDFATGLGLSLPFVQAIFGELEEYGAEFDWGDEVYENTGDAIVSVNEQIQNLEDSLAYLEEQKAAGVKIDDSYILELQEQLKEAIMLRDDLCEEATTKVTSNIEIKEQLSQAREELASWQSQLEQDPTNVEIQAHVDESQEKVKSFEQDLETIGEPTTVEINVAKENIDKEIEETQAKIDQLSDKEYLVKMGISEEGASYTIDTLKTKIDELETEKGKIVSVYGDTSDAETEIDDINKEEIPDKEFNVEANIAVAKSRINQIKNALDTIQDKTVTVTTKYGGIGRINGTAHLSGTANASGNWGAKTGGTALVGELGPEIIVESRTGRWYTVGDNGAEFVNIPKNSIVFNHLQTQELLSKGYVSSRAMAFARGTAYASGTAMVTGGGLSASIVRTQSATKGTSTSSKGEKESAAIAENTRKAAEAAEEFNEQIDWIKTNLERINTLLGWAKDDIDEIGKSGGFESRIADIEKALSYANSYKDAAYKAGNVYQTYADSLGLANEYVEKIKNGTMAIETITDETLKDQISRYQDWYEKAIDCFNVVRDMNEEIKSLQLQKLDAVETWADSRINYQEALANRMQAYIDLADTKGIDNTESQLNYMIDRQVTIRGKLNTELTNLKNQFQNLMNNGTIQKYSDEWHEWMAKIYDVETAITETETAVEELQNEINDLRWEKFERGITVIENASEELSDLIDLYDDSMLFDDNGKTTSAGNTVVALYEHQVELATLKAKQYADAIIAVRKELLNGNISQNEYNDKVAEYSKLQREASAEVKNYRDAIVSLITDGINKETDAYTKLNDAKKEALQAQKDLDDYAKQVSEKSNAVSKLEAEYAPLVGVSGREAQAKREQLLQQIEDAKTELKELQDDRAYNDQLDYLDKDSERFEAAQDERIEMLSSSLDYQNAEIAEFVANANLNAEEVLSNISELSENYGMVISDALTAPWENAMSAMDEYLLILNALGIGVGAVDTSKLHSPNYSTAIKTSNYSNAAGAVNSFAEDEKWKQLQHTVATREASGNPITQEELIEMIMEIQKNTQKYASGTRRVGKGVYTTNENGLEAIMTEYGLLTPLVGDSTIFSADATNVLYDFANNPAQFMQNNLPSLPKYDIQKTNPTIINKYDSLITVNGDVIEDTIPKISDIVKSAIPAVKQDLANELHLLGRNINYYR